MSDFKDDDSTNRRADPLGPPAEPCECYCLHCQRVFMSDQIWFQKVINSSAGFDGFWMCPTPNCDGAGFTFDIFPTDPHHPANSGWVDDEFEEVDWDHEEGYEDETDEDDDDDDMEFPLDLIDEDAEWDPSEPDYPALGEDDTEGEEWKLGQAPDEAFSESNSNSPSESSQWENQQQKYDEPDQRPRVLDWSNRDQSSDISADDIPF